MNKKTIVLSFISFLLTAHVIAQAPRSYTSSEILLQLKKLNTVGSVLYIAAHPDDENTRLIAYLANEKCLRTGYLSLTRGDGGQNLIGPEQGVELGVIRTQELLAARRIDGGEQFFTRAYDFGFSKSPEETLQKWNKDSILSDMVWVIRNFRPDIIITRFATDGSGGHGHHTTSAILAEEAFDAAGDPTRFTEQLQHVEVWKPRRLFWNVSTRFQNPNADMSPYLKLDVGGYNPLLGKSYGEIAAESRSMHKSQGFGSAKQRGEYFEYFKPLKGDTANLKDIFEGIDFSWKRVKGGEKINGMIKKIIKKYDINNPHLVSKELYELYIVIDKLKDNNLYFKEKDCSNLIVTVNGLFVELLAESHNISLRTQVEDLSPKLTLNIINRSKLNSKFRYGIGTDCIILGPTSKLKSDSTNSLKINSIYYNQYNQEYNGTFWLNKPIKNSLYNIDGFWSRVKPEIYYESKINLGFTYYIGKDSIQVGTNPNLQYKWVDPEKGELYRPVVITPPVMINPQNKLVTFTDSKVKELRVSLKAGRDSVRGLIQIALPKGWYVVLKGSKFNNQLKAPTESAFTFSLAKKGDVEDVVLEINPYEGAQDTTISITALVDGQTYTKGIKEIKYDHIPIQTLFPEAEVKLVKLDVVKKSKRIGYIPGAGDEVQACLSQLGYEVTILTDDKLASENLNTYDAIITGVRAYNTNEKLPSFKQKLMDYVAAGGNLIVQYNTNSWAGPFNSDIGPYKFKITRNRITDEEAKVNFILPNHPVFNSPNKITEKDFEGWMQERSIYHAGDWDSNYVAPISMTDPYEMTIGGISPKGKPDHGALIIAKHGKGNFVYTGLVFFRQLPAGVPGAYRFMVNLIELGK
jgi:LmbE family N-acetylglucosaminyl deacetylase